MKTDIEQALKIAESASSSSNKSSPTSSTGSKAVGVFYNLREVSRGCKKYKIQFPILRNVSIAIVKQEKPLSLRLKSKKKRRSCKL